MAIEFEEQDQEFHIKSRRLLGEPETPTMIRFLLKSGIVSNEKQALGVLIAVIIVATGAAFFVANNIPGKIKDETFIDEYGNKTTLSEHIKSLRKSN